MKASAMSKNDDLKPIQYYELLDIKEILNEYAEEAETPILRSCYENALKNIEKILETYL